MFRVKIARVICARCAAEHAEAGDACGACGAAGDALLAGGRYRLEEVLGHGASGVTYRARRVADGEVVCVKELQFRRIGSYDVLKLFRREAEVLRQLDHPGVPRYVDDFTAGEGKTVSLYLVQELIEGKNLRQELEDRRYHEREVLEIVAGLLPVLDYLHSLSPPVIHRDIKPSNVMRRARDGSLVLIDFGAVKDAVRDSVVGGSTIVGTFGYTAPEQLYGRASPASDLYALGALAVALLSRREPADLVDAGHRLRWQEHVRVSRATARLLESLLEQDPARRPQSAAAVAREVARALAALAAAPPAGGEGAVAALPSGDAPAGAAESPPRRLPREARILLWGAGVAAVIAFVVGLWPGRDRPRAAAVKSCPVGPCQPVPRGLLGLSFGMSLEDASAARPELAQAAVEQGSATSATWVDHEMSPHFASVTVPGPRVSIETRLLSFPASCELQFHLPASGSSVDDVIAAASGEPRPDLYGLSKVSCSLAPFETEPAHRAAEEVIRLRFEELHGPPDHEGEAWAPQPRGHWRWRDDHAVLSMESRFDQRGLEMWQRFGSLPGSPPEPSRWSSLVVENVAVEHERLLARLRSEAEMRERERLRRDAERTREAIEREKEKILRELGE